MVETAIETMAEMKNEMIMLRRIAMAQIAMVVLAIFFLLALVIKMSLRCACNFLYCSRREFMREAEHFLCRYFASFN